ncbi:MAG TPA: type II toxin-antitoxin system VapC family toxin [Rhodothermales bacterium]|nr:type II toxin-antitoxin system VapC family toxin [Rhodothermales bacterium]
MAEPLLVDTDVLIDYLRDSPEAAAFLEAQSVPLLVSAVTVAELYAGVREGAERDRLDVFLDAFEVLVVERATAEQGGLFRRDYGKSHGTGLADALIAAQAVAQGATLVTLNRKHFPMLRAVWVPYQKS